MKNILKLFYKSIIILLISLGLLIILNIKIFSNNSFSNSFLKSTINNFINLFYLYNSYIKSYDYLINSNIYNSNSFIYSNSFLNMEFHYLTFHINIFYQIQMSLCHLIR
jgi:hypothetical protein